jgi:hypothetical protein
MNSKIRTPDRVEIYVNAEEIHFLANAATNWFTNDLYFRGPLQQTARSVTNSLQELSMRLRAMEVAPAE